MSGQFDHPRCSVLVVTGDAQFFALDLVFESFIQAVIARKDFRRLVLPVDPVCLSAWNNSYNSFLSNQRAGKFGDQFQLRIWRGFFVIRIVEP